MLCSTWVLLGWLGLLGGIVLLLEDLKEDLWPTDRLQCLGLSSRLCFMVCGVCFVLLLACFFLNNVNRKWEDKWQSGSNGRPQLLVSYGWDPGLFCWSCLARRAGFCCLPCVSVSWQRLYFCLSIPRGVWAPSSFRDSWVIQQEVAATFKSKQYLSLGFEIVSHKHPFSLWVCGYSFTLSHSVKCW